MEAPKNNIEPIQARGHWLKVTYNHKPDFDINKKTVTIEYEPKFTIQEVYDIIKEYERIKNK